MLRVDPSPLLLTRTGQLFFEKVQFDFQLANLAIQFIFFSVGLRARGFVAVGEQRRQMVERLLLPFAHQIGVNTERLGDLSRGLLTLQRFHATLALRLGGWLFRVLGMISH